MVQGKITEADTPTIQPGATPCELTSAHLHHPPIFYRPHALPAAQPKSVQALNTTPHHNRFMALFRDHPGEPVPEENFWTLWCKGRLTEADTLTIRLGGTPSRLTSAHLHHPLILFYVPDALPAAQATVSSSEGN